jgi:hypothetical protein
MKVRWPLPNWCENTVNVSGAKKQIARFVKFVGEDFDFEKFFPCPPELYEVVSPAEVVEDDDPKKDEVSSFDGKKRCITKSKSQELIKKFWHNTWYEWCCANWGVKWPASDVQFNDCTDTVVQWTFNTPWGPPTGVVALLKKKFPKLEIVWEYREEGMGLNGVL